MCLLDVLKVKLSINTDSFGGYWNLQRIINFLFELRIFKIGLDVWKLFISWCNWSNLWTNKHYFKLMAAIVTVLCSQMDSNRVLLYPCLTLWSTAIMSSLQAFRVVLSRQTLHTIFIIVNLKIINIPSMFVIYTSLLAGLKLVRMEGISFHAGCPDRFCT